MMKREYESFPMYKEFRYEILKNNKGKYIKILDFDNSTSSPVIPAYIKDIPVTVIGKDAFERSDIKTITLPDTLTTIEAYAFFNCRSLEKISFPDSVRDVGHQVCGLCQQLEEAKWSQLAHIMPACAFYDCFSLKNISNIDSVYMFSEYCFNKTGLESITIPKKISTISHYALGECPNLKIIKMSHLPNIDKEAFRASENIQIDCCGNGKVKEWAKKHGFPIIENKLNTFLQDLNEEVENSEKGCDKQ